MSDRPTTTFFWATDPTVRVQPSDAKRNSGWNIVKEKPSRQHTNWLFYYVGIWFDYINTRFVREYSSPQEMLEDTDLQDGQSFVIRNNYSDNVNPVMGFDSGTVWSRSFLDVATQRGYVQRVMSTGKYVVARVTSVSGAAYDEIHCMNSDDGLDVWTLSVNNSSVFTTDGKYVYVNDDINEVIKQYDIVTGDFVQDFATGITDYYVVDMTTDGWNFYFIAYDTNTNITTLYKGVTASFAGFNQDFATNENASTVSKNGFRVYLGTLKDATYNLQQLHKDTLFSNSYYQIPDTNVRKVVADNDMIVLSLQDDGASGIEGTYISPVSLNSPSAAFIGNQISAYRFNDAFVDDRYIHVAQYSFDADENAYMITYEKNSGRIVNMYYWEGLDALYINPIISVCSDCQKVYFGGYQDTSVSGLMLIAMNLPNQTLNGTKTPYNYQGRRYPGLLYDSK